MRGDGTPPGDARGSLRRVVFWALARSSGARRGWSTPGASYWLNPGMPTPAWTGRTDRYETAREEQTRSDSEMIDA